MKKERRELVELMSIPFKYEPSYFQTKLFFEKFLSEMAAPTLLHSLSMIRGEGAVDQKQRVAAYRLLAAIEADEITKDDAIAHGNWYSYLLEHLKADEK